MDIDSDVEAVSIIFFEVLKREFRAPSRGLVGIMERFHGSSCVYRVDVKGILFRVWAE